MYPSVSIGEWLRDTIDMTFIGTWQKGRQGFPNELKVKKVTDEAYSSKIYHLEDSNMHLTNYVTKKKSGGKRNVTILSTVKPISGITKDDKKKPQIFKLYDFTKSGNFLSTLSFYSSTRL